MKFKFKLKALLKMINLEENNIKYSIGKINTNKEELNERILTLRENILKSNEIENKYLTESARFSDIYFWGVNRDSCRHKILSLENDISILEDKLKEELLKLREVRNRRKVIEKLREKEFTEFKKFQNKYEERKLDELIQYYKKV